MKITKNTVVGLWEHMLKTYKTRWHYKPTNKRMKRFRRLVILFRVMPKEQFDKFSMSLPNDIYIIYRYADKGTQEQYTRRIENCVHEHVHCYDGVNYWKYLLSKAYRIDREIEAYKANMVMRWVCTGKFLNPGHLANGLKRYKASKKQVEKAKKEFELTNHYIRVSAFARFHPVVRQAVWYLWENGV